MGLQTNTISNDLLATMNGSRAATKSTADAAQDRFMTLLVTQMKNQDPLNPMDNAQVTSQLAQLSTVTGIDKLNETVKGLQASYMSSQSLQSAALIGHGVLSPGQTLNLSEGKAIFGYELTEPADKVTVSVLDGANNVVHSRDISGQDVGIYPMTWDGMRDSGTQAPNGNYKLQVTATRGDKKLEGVQSLQFGMVSSVSTGAQGVKVNLNGIGAVDLNAVRQIL